MIRPNSLTRRYPAAANRAAQGLLLVVAVAAVLAMGSVRQWHIASPEGVVAAPPSQVRSASGGEDHDANPAPRKDPVRLEAPAPKLAAPRNGPVHAVGDDRSSAGTGSGPGTETGTDTALEAATDVAKSPPKVFAIARHPKSGKPVRAEIITCPRCRLNSLPLVREFVMEDAPNYGNSLKVNFIIGEDPRLHLYENDKEVANIDLSLYTREQIVHRLAAFGIYPKERTSELNAALAAKNVQLPPLGHA